MGYKWKYCDLIPDPVFKKTERKEKECAKTFALIV